MPKLRIVFFGFQTWGYVSLEALLQDSRYEVPLVITHPEGENPYEQIWNDSVSALAEQHGCKVLTASRASDPSIAHAIEAINPDIALASDWRTHVPDSIIKLFPKGCINIHDALLPKYGGFAPINWAIINNEKEIGVTAHFMEHAIDLGPIICQHRIPVGPDDTATVMAKRVFESCRAITTESLERIGQADFQPTPQDSSQATFFHKRSIRDGKIDWNKSNLEVYNLIRAQSDPYPNAYTKHNQTRLWIKKARVSQQTYCGTPGRIFCRESGGVIVLCGKGPYGTPPSNQGLVLESVQPEDGPVMPADHYFKRMADYLE